MLYKLLITTMAVTTVNSSFAQALTLDDALNAVKQHPQWVAAEALIAQAKGQQITASQYPNPTIDLASETHDRQSVAMMFPLETPNVRQYRQLSAEAQVVVNESQAYILQQELKNRIKKEYFLILQRKEDMALAQDEFNLLGQLRHAVQLRVKVGEAARYESVKAEAEWLSSKNRLEVSQKRLLLAKQQLSDLLALPSITAVVDISKGSDVCSVKNSANGFTSLQQHPLFKSSSASVTRDQSTLRQEQSLVTPQPSFIVGTEHEMGIERFKLGVSLPLPLWHQRDGQIATAKAKLQQSEAELNATERQLKQVYSQVLSRYQVADSQVNIFQSGLLAEAEAAFRVAKAAYKHGERGLLEYIDAQRTLASVRRDFVNSQFERHYACFDIELLTQSYGVHHE